MIASKTCHSCGRTITWRKKWERNWDEIRYCSAKCRRQKTNRIDQELEETITTLLTERGREKTICPSEAARHYFPEDQWRDEMERTRAAARRLVARGEIEILQKGQLADPSTAKGPIRLRKKQIS